MASARKKSSPSPMLLSVLSSSRDHSDDMVVQLRNRLGQIEANVQEALAKIHQRKPYVALASNDHKADQQMRNHFFDVLKTVASKNNLPFDETFFRQQFLEVQENNDSPNVDVVRDKNDTSDQHLSPIINRQRSQFAPVLSSTPVHQTSPITLISVDLSLATPSVPTAPPILTVASTLLPPIPPSAIAPQRANVNRAARKPSADGRPPRAPPVKRVESATRRKRSSPPPSTSPTKQEEVIVTKEVRVTSKRRIRSKQQAMDSVEESVAVIIEQREEVVVPEFVKKVQSTPLRGRKKKIEEQKEEIDIIPQLEPPPAEPLKKTRAGRNKKKEESIVVVASKTRTASLSTQNQQHQPETVSDNKPVPVLNLGEIEEPPKKATRGRKKHIVAETIKTNDENPPPVSMIPIKVRSTPLRGKKKTEMEAMPDLDLPPLPVSSPQKTTKTKITNTKSKKRKDNEDSHEKPVDSIQPPSPKRRAGRNTKKDSETKVIDLLPPPPEAMVTPPSTQEPPPTIRSSRRGKQDDGKEQEIEITKKVRPGRGKKKSEPMAVDPVVYVDLVRTSVTVSVFPTSSIDSLVAKPPRPPVMRKKKSIELPPLPRMSPSTPPPPRMQSISPVDAPSLLPIPLPVDGDRRRRQARRAVAASPTRSRPALDDLPSAPRARKRTRSSATGTPKRPRRENLVLTTMPGTPGKKRNKCTCQKRGNKSCDICATAFDA